MLHFYQVLSGYPGCCPKIFMFHLYQCKHLHLLYFLSLSQTAVFQCIYSIMSSYCSVYLEIAGLKSFNSSETPLINLVPRLYLFWEFFLILLFFNFLSFKCFRLLISAHNLLVFLSNQTFHFGDWFCCFYFSTLYPRCDVITAAML